MREVHGWMEARVSLHDCFNGMGAIETGQMVRG
jgi:hypothetical protein